MAQVSLPSYNPVPSGQAGSGEAFILGNGLLPLQTLQRSDAVNQRRAYQLQQAKIKQEQEGLKNFTSAAARIDTKGYLPWQPELTADLPKVWDDLLKAGTAPGMNEYEKRAAQEKIITDRQAKQQVTVEVEKKVNELRGVLSDKRYNKKDVETAWFNGMASSRVQDYDPTNLEKELDNPKNFNQTEVVSQWLDALYEKETSRMEKQGTPGSYGQNNSATSQLFVVENGRIKIDPTSRKPVLRTDSPDALVAASRDPFLGKLLDYMREQDVTGSDPATLNAVTAKMQNNEQLTPEEQQFVANQRRPKTSVEYLSDLVRPFASGSQTQENPYSRPITPRAAAAPSGPATSGTAGFGVAGGITQGGGPGNIPSPVVFPAPMIQAKDGTMKPVVIKGAVFRNFSLQEPGKERQLYTNNTEGQDLIPGEARMVLVDKNGRIFSPTNPAVSESKEATEEWIINALRRPQAKTNGYRLTYAVQGTPVKGENNLGSEEEYYQSIKQSYTQPAATTAATGSLPSFQGAGGSKSRAMPSEKEMRETARKLHAKSNGTYFIPYEADNKRKLDSATPVYRQQEAQMRAEIQRLTSRVGQPTTKADPLGFTPKPATQKAPASKVKLVGKNNALGF